MTPPESPEDRLLREWLTREALPPLPDAGFTQRVLASLPPPRPQRDWLTLGIITTGGAIGLAWSLLDGGNLSSLVAALARLADWSAANATFAAAIGLAIWFLVEATASSLPPPPRQSRL